MADDDWKIVERDTLLLQDRVITRLRAALLANGLTLAEVDMIARDGDVVSVTPVPDDLDTWKRHAEAEIQSAFGAMNRDLALLVQSFDERFLAHLNLIGDCTRAYNRLEGRTIRGRARRLWAMVKKSYYRVRYWRHEDDDA